MFVVCLSVLGNNPALAKPESSVSLVGGTDVGKHAWYVQYNGFLTHQSWQPKNVQKQFPGSLVLSGRAGRQGMRTGEAWVVLCSWACDLLMHLQPGRYSSVIQCTKADPAGNEMCGGKSQQQVPRDLKVIREQRFLKSIISAR